MLCKLTKLTSKSGHKLGFHIYKEKSSFPSRSIREIEILREHPWLIRHCGMYNGRLQL